MLGVNAYDQVRGAAASCIHYTACNNTGVKFSDYFERERRERPDRRDITIEMCEWVKANAVDKDDENQPKGRTAYWGYVEEKERYLKVVVEPDGETVFNTFWDRNFKRKMERQGRQQEDEG